MFGLSAILLACSSTRGRCSSTWSIVDGTVLPLQTASHFRPLSSASDRSTNSISTEVRLDPRDPGAGAHGVTTTPIASSRAAPLSRLHRRALRHGPARMGRPRFARRAPAPSRGTRGTAPALRVVQLGSMNRSHRSPGSGASGLDPIRVRGLPGAGRAGLFDRLDRLWAAWLSYRRELAAPACRAPGVAAIDHSLLERVVEPCDRHQLRTTRGRSHAGCVRAGSPLRERLAIRSNPDLYTLQRPMPNVSSVPNGRQRPANPSVRSGASAPDAGTGHGRSAARRRGRAGLHPTIAGARAAGRVAAATILPASAGRIAMVEQQTAATGRVHAPLSRRTCQWRRSAARGGANAVGVEAVQMTRLTDLVAEQVVDDPGTTAAAPGRSRSRQSVTSRIGIADPRSAASRTRRARLPCRFGRAGAQCSSMLSARSP